MYRVQEIFKDEIPVTKIMTKVEMLNIKAKQQSLLR
jgi:hypothetical protein